MATALSRRSSAAVSAAAVGRCALQGRRVLLFAEQGLGDTLLCARYAGLVKQRGGHVIFACQTPLLRLLASLPGVDQLVAREQPLPDFDVYAPLMSLPRIFGTTVATVPAPSPYLTADPGLVERWRHELAPYTGFRIGIAWQGNPRYGLDRHRSFPLKQFAALARIPGVRLFSLQKNDGLDQLRDLGGQFPVIDLGPKLDVTTGPFLDTAAAMKNLDLVISPDTSLAHLAGALAVPVWLALSDAPAWHWLVGREDSPWYPTLRIFRQRRIDDWDDVFRRITAALEQRLSLSPGYVPSHALAAPAAPSVRSRAANDLVAQAWRCHQADDYAQAQRLCRQVLQTHPDDAEVWRLLGEACLLQGQPTAAATALREALRLGPKLAELHCNLGAALARLGQPDEAAASYRQALALKPNYAAAHNNLGVALTELNRPEEAVVEFHAALRVQPHDAEALNGLGMALAALGRMDEAVSQFEQSLQQRPDYATAHYNLGSARLMRGEFAQGWPEFEWRRRRVPDLVPEFRKPEWNGEALHGRTVLLYAEQGLGDTLQCVRYAPLVKQRGGRVILACQKPLLRLLAGLPGLDVLTPREETLPDFDVFAPLMSLPRIFNTTLDNLPADVPYLAADPASCSTGERFWPHLPVSRSASPGKATRALNPTGAARFRCDIMPPWRAFPACGSSACKRSTAWNSCVTSTSISRSTTWDPNSTKRRARSSTRPR